MFGLNDRSIIIKQYSDWLNPWVRDPVATKTPDPVTSNTHTIFAPEKDTGVALRLTTDTGQTADLCDVYLYPKVHPLAVRMRDIEASDWFHSNPSVTEFASKYGLEPRLAARVMSRYDTPIRETVEVKHNSDRTISMHIQAPCLRSGTKDSATAVIIFRANKNISTSINTDVERI